MDSSVNKNKRQVNWRSLNVTEMFRNFIVTICALLIQTLLNYKNRSRSASSSKARHFSEEKPMPILLPLETHLISQRKTCKKIIIELIHGLISIF